MDRAGIGDAIATRATSAVALTVISTPIDSRGAAVRLIDWPAPRNAMMRRWVAVSGIRPGEGLVRFGHDAR
jgi:hypothetical protein